MSLTNFAKLTDNELLTWGRDFWREVREHSFINQLAGDTASSVVHRCKELKKTAKGNRALITLIHETEGDGVVGDRTLKGNEAPMSSAEQMIRFDQMRNAHSHEGRMAEQKSVITFRKEAKSNLAFWMSDRLDQLAMLTLAGVDYSMNTNGSTRVGSEFPLLEFAADVSAPTSNRHIRWDATTGIEAGDTSALIADDKLSWSALIQAKAMAKERYLKPARTKDGVEMYHLFVTPTTMAHLKQDPDFKSNLQYAERRSSKNPLFKGADTYYVDGLAIHEHRYVYNTMGAASGSKWGGSGTVDGSRVLICGAQALGYADIKAPYWVEEDDDYKNRQGISIGKMVGFVKPKFDNLRTGQKEDFGVMVMDVAQ